MRNILLFVLSLSPFWTEAQSNFLHILDHEPDRSGYQVLEYQDNYIIVAANFCDSWYECGTIMEVWSTPNKQDIKFG